MIATQLRAIATTLLQSIAENIDVNGWREEGAQLAGHLNALADRVDVNERNPPRFQRGDVVWLKAALEGGAQPATILEVHPADEQKPVTYALALQSRDGNNLLTFNMPEYALCSAPEAS